ncbi:hypothetical protein EYZ11_001858 [Aspergillus tanneri]|nr:hypothetical protein EYZ11_001858 [Aspergillus tanneri]
MSGVPGFGNGCRPKGAAAATTRPCVFRVIRVSGTMRKAEEEAIRRARKEIVRLRDTEEVGVLEGLVRELGQEDGLSTAMEEDVEMASDDENDD